MKTRLKINGFIMSVAILSIALFPAVFFRVHRESFFETITEVFGITFILLGQIFRVSARGFKSEHSGNGYSLIKSGPYALVRNPMYLGILLIGLGIVAVLFKWWAAVIFLAVFIIRYLLLILKEERKLLGLFPEDYQNYKMSAPRILPSISTILRQDISEYLPIKMSWLKREIGSILAVLMITLFLESWEDIRSEGISAYLKEAMGILVVIMLFICLVSYLSRRTILNNVSNKS